MHLENIKTELIDIINSINNKKNFNTTLDEFNLFLKRFLEDSVAIDGFEVNSNILSLFIYLLKPLIYFDIIDNLDIHSKNQLLQLQKDFHHIFNTIFYEMIFTTDPFNKFYTNNNLLLSTYFSESLAIYGKVNLTLEKDFTNTLLKKIIFYSLLGSFKLSTNDAMKIMDWLSEYYFKYGECTSYVFI
ncbi:hypothetical protein C5S23_03820 [Clostridium perfringens]|nr:hypothetical protein [Clostridium perfringens]